MAALGGERFGEQRLVLDGVRDQDQARRRLVVVELRQEGRKHFARPERFVGFGKIGAVAPVLPGAEEEHFDAGEAALLMHGKDVGLLDGARIDALLRLDRRQRGETIAVDRGVLEIERRGRFLHCRGELVLDRLAAAGQERVGLAHQRRVIAELDLLGARRRAALDLIEQTRPGAAFEERIAARAQQKRALQGVDGAVDRPHRGERAVILAGPRARAAMFQNLRRPVIRGDQDIGKRFVVAQRDVEARPQPLDQVGFEQQRLGLGAGDDEFERAGLSDHALDAGIEAGRPRVGADALLDVLGFADIEHVAAAIDHAIDAGPRRRLFDGVDDGVAAGGERTRLLLVALDCRGLVRVRQRRLVVLFDEIRLRRDVFLRIAHACRRFALFGLKPSQAANIGFLNDDILELLSGSSPLN